MLFKNRNLNIAILISATWHLVCMFSIVPVLLPQHAGQDRATISFLGSILEKVSPVKEKLFVMEKFSNSIGSSKISLARPEIVSDILDIRQEKEEVLTGISWDDGTADFNTPYRKEQSEIKFSNFLLKGEAKDRAVLYKPELGRLSLLPSDFNSDHSMNIKFRISRDGFVKGPQCVISSGSPDIDRIGVNYIRKWRFVPSVHDNQEGIVRITLEAQ